MGEGKSQMISPKAKCHPFRSGKFGKESLVLDRHWREIDANLANSGEVSRKKSRIESLDRSQQKKR